MNACYGGHDEVVAFLIDQGADVNVLAPTAHRYRPLHRTVEFKKTAPKRPATPRRCGCCWLTAPTRCCAAATTW